MPMTSRLTDEQKEELRAYAQSFRRSSCHFVVRPSTADLCAYTLQHFDVSYGHRAMHKIMVSLGLVYNSNVNAWREPGR